MVAKNELRVMLQTGRTTPPDLLLRDLETVQNISIDVRRLGASFLGGGIATFITISTDCANIAAMAEILSKHTKRLNTKGGDELVILIGGCINTSEEIVGFRDVQCQKNVFLKEKSQDEIKRILEEDV